MTHREVQLVARGFTHAHGIDYTKTFSLVDCMNSIHVLLSLHQLDISNAFIYGDLVEQIFIEQPLGYVAHGKTSLVFLLCCAIYGLKQSPHSWFVQFNGLFTAHGFNRESLIQ